MAKTNETENAAFRIHPVLIVIMGLVVFLAITVVTLYPVVRDYYIAQRENSRLYAEAAALDDRNSTIRQRIDALQTLEGIEDRAREEFGWVREGEQAVNITGLESLASTTGLPAAVEPGSVPAPTTWLFETLDEFFGVEDHQEKDPYPDDAIPGL